MKKLVALLLCLGILGTSACSSKETTITKSPGENATSSSGGVEVDEGLFTVTITIPASFMGETTQAEQDKLKAEKGYKSATLNADGSVTYVMTKAKHKEIMKQMADELDKSFQKMIDDEESSIASITHNDDYTEFKIGYDGDEIGLADSFAAVSFYMAGNMYGAFNGKVPENVHVVFVNSKTGKTIQEGNSRDMASSSDSDETKSEDNSQYKSVELVDSGYSILKGSDYLTWVAIIKNPDGEAIYEFPVITITAYDKNGAVIATEDQTLGTIEPGETQAFSGSMDYKGATVGKVEITVNTGKRTNSAEKHIKSSDFSTEGVNVRKGSISDKAFTGKIKNNSSVDCKSAHVTIIFKKDGKVIYGLTDYVENIEAGKDKAFEIEGSVPAYDEFVINVIDWS